MSRSVSYDDGSHVTYEHARRLGACQRCLGLNDPQGVGVFRPRGLGWTRVYLCRDCCAEIASAEGYVVMPEAELKPDIDQVIEQLLAGT